MDTNKENHNRKRFLGVHFKTCNVYTRIYQNVEKTAYIGRCPKCGRPIRVLIGVTGTNKRFIEAHCL